MTDPMFTTTTEYGLSFREQLVLEITRGLASWDSGCLKEGYRGKVAEGIVDLANLIYEEKRHRITMKSRRRTLEKAEVQVDN